MRIQGPQGPRPAQSARRSDKTGSTGDGSGFASLLGTEEGGSPAPAQSARPLGGIDPLFAVQAADEQGGNRRRARKRAGDILDRLEELRQGLLSGGLSETHLSAIQQTVAEQRDLIDDPALAALLDEIDLLAAVEVAKLEVARDDARERQLINHKI
jgi:hypothetical protein